MSRSGIVLAGAAAVLVAFCIAILVSSAALRPPALKTASVEETAPSDPATAPATQRLDGKSTATAADGASQTGGSGVTNTVPERIEPRDPLSEIGQALPPKPKQPGEWKGTTLFNPVATAAGLIEAKGYKLAIAGVKPVRPEEMCTFEGREWPCGLRARAAFRAWLRARAITCVVPPDPERETIVAECRVGKQDVGEWLVASGWAHPDGENYSTVGEAASKEAKGIFGRPAATGAPMPSITTSVLPSASDNGVILAPTPADQEEVFPPAPPPPTGSSLTPPAAPLPPAQ